MPRLSAVLLVILACAGTAGPASASPAISDSRARTLFPAVARVILQRETTTHLLNYCAGRFDSLRQDSQHARTRWLQRNRAILHKAAALRVRLWQSLKQQQSGLKAETFNLDIDRLVQQHVKQAVKTLGAYSVPQQHAVCHHLILAVRTGDWDVSRKQAKAYAVLKDFH